MEFQIVIAKIDNMRMDSRLYVISLKMQKKGTKYCTLFDE